MSVSDRQCVIIPILKEGLGGESYTRGTKGTRYGWMGANNVSYNAHCLFIYDREWPLSKKGDVGCDLRGWGFCPIFFVGDKQGYAWDGQTISPTVFEIAVTADSLTAAEEPCLLQENAQGRDTAEKVVAVLPMQTAVPGLTRHTSEDVASVPGIKSTPPVPSAPPLARPSQIITATAYVDDQSELHITKDGLYWRQVSQADKPGRSGGYVRPTTINGVDWFPKWKSAAVRGPDTSAVFPLATASEYRLAVVAVGVTSLGKGIEKRDPVTIRKVGGEQVVTIPDTQSGARWYTITLTPVDPSAN